MTGRVLRNWCVCVIKDDEDYVMGIHRTLLAAVPGENDMRYLVWQLERGGQTHLLHIQAYIEFTRGKRYTAVKRYFGGIARTEGREGTREQAINYVTKEDTRVEGPFERGEAPQQGQRTDLEEIRTMVDEGQTDLSIWQEHFPTMARHFRAIAQYRLVRAVARGATPDNYSLPTVKVFWGGTGLGKTRRAIWEIHAAGRRAFFPDVPDRIGGERWFDGYQEGDAIVIDDYKGEYSINFFKRLLDGYPVSLRIKGSYQYARPDLIYITSNHDPLDWYPEALAVDRQALRRRYQHVEHMSMPWAPPEEYQDAQDPDAFPDSPQL